MLLASSTLSSKTFIKMVDVVKVGVMQPYLFPYLGYYQLVSCVDHFVFYDDVTFIKQGYINRNSILGDRTPLRITFPVFDASSNRLISDHSFCRDFSKQVKSIEQAYSKAPYFKLFFPRVLSVLESPDRDVTRVCRKSIETVLDYLDIPFNHYLSSSLQYDRAKNRADKLVSICKNLGGDTYVNSIGGSELYEHDSFSMNGIDLLFIKMMEITYKQRRVSDPFIPNLSMIDAGMWCPPEKIREMLLSYQLVKIA